MVLLNKVEKCVSLEEFVRQDHQPLTLVQLANIAKILQLGFQQPHVRVAMSAVLEKLSRILKRSFAVLDFIVKQEPPYKFHVPKDDTHLAREHHHWIIARHVHLDKFVIKKVWLDL